MSPNGFMPEMKSGSRQCAECGLRKTAQWRTGPRDVWLCNRCGVRYHKVLKVAAKLGLLKTRAPFPRLVGMKLKFDPTPQAPMEVLRVPKAHLHTPKPRSKPKPKKSENDAASHSRTRVRTARTSTHVPPSGSFAASCGSRAGSIESAWTRESVAPSAPSRSREASPVPLMDSTSSAPSEAPVWWSSVEDQILE